MDRQTLSSPGMGDFLDLPFADQSRMFWGHSGNLRRKKVVTCICLKVGTRSSLMPLL